MEVGHEVGMPPRTLVGDETASRGRPWGMLAILTRPAPDYALASKNSVSPVYYRLVQGPLSAASRCRCASRHTKDANARLNTLGRIRTGT